MYFEKYLTLKHYNKIYFLLIKNFLGKFIKKGKKVFALKSLSLLKY